MDLGKWRGLFDWSMRYADGAEGSRFTEMPPEKKAWLMDALQHYMQDFAERMKEIKTALDDTSGAEAGSATSLEEKEALLDELTDIVSNMDFARDLHKIGGLPTLLDLLSNPAPSLCWRAAEVVATCVQNNPPVQQWFMQGGVMPPLRALLGDNNATCKTKALLAISAMVRHYAPAREEFLTHEGMRQLVECVAAEDSRLSRKALSLLHYFCFKDGALGLMACESGAVPTLLQCLDREASDLREAALSVLLDLARTPETWDVLQQVSGLPEKLQALQDNIKLLPESDQEAQAEEYEMCSSLQQCLQHRPSERPSNNDDIVATAAEVEGQAQHRHTLNVGAANQQEQPAQPQQQQQAWEQASEQTQTSYGGGLALVPVPDYDPR